MVKKSNLIEKIYEIDIGNNGRDNTNKINGRELFIGIKDPSKFVRNRFFPVTIGFDFDGVIATADSESIVHNRGLEEYIKYEQTFGHIPLLPGPVCDFARKLFFIKKQLGKKYGKENLIRLYLISARSSKVAKRVFSTLRYCNLSFDLIFLLGGQSKLNVLRMVQPDLYFDDHFDNMEWYYDKIVMKLNIL